MLILTRLPVSNHAIFHDEFIERNREKGRKNLNLFFSILKRSKHTFNISLKYKNCSYHYFMTKKIEKGHCIDFNLHVFAVKQGLKVDF